MKYRIINIIIFLFLNNFILFAHSGNTDSKGGHYNTETGEYHYHNDDNGYFALIILILIGLGSFYFLYIISEKQNKDNSKNAIKKYILTDEQKRINDEINKLEKERQRKLFWKNIGGCFTYVIAFILTMISIVILPGGWNFLAVIVFILFISYPRN